MSVVEVKYYKKHLLLLNRLIRASIKDYLIKTPSKLSSEDTITLFNKLFVKKDNHFVPIDMPVNINHDEFKKIKSPNAPNAPKVSKKTKKPTEPTEQELRMAKKEAIKAEKEVRRIRREKRSTKQEEKLKAEEEKLKILEEEKLKAEEEAKEKLKVKKPTKEEQKLLDKENENLLKQAQRKATITRMYNEFNKEFIIPFGKDKTNEILKRDMINEFVYLANLKPIFLRYWQDERKPAYETYFKEAIEKDIERKIKLQEKQIDLTKQIKEEARRK